MCPLSFVHFDQVCHNSQITNIALLSSPSVGSALSLVRPSPYSSLPTSVSLSVALTVRWVRLCLSAASEPRTTWTGPSSGTSS